MTANAHTPASTGLRARKRRETLQRITDSGIGLFIRQGYEATTIDQIAEAAGISRRTFFHYFRSKDDILVSLQSGMGAMLAEAVRTAPEGARPLHAIRDAVIAVCATIPADDMMAIDRLMRANPTVQARKQASYVEHERELFAALTDRWPDPARATGLRLVALLAVGAVRLAQDALAREGGKRPLTALIGEAFDALEAELPG